MPNRLQRKFCKPGGSRNGNGRQLETYRHRVSSRHHSFGPLHRPRAWNQRQHDLCFRSGLCSLLGGFVSHRRVDRRKCSENCILTWQLSSRLSKFHPFHKTAFNIRFKGKALLRLGAQPGRAHTNSSVPRITVGIFSDSGGFTATAYPPFQGNLLRHNQQPKPRDGRFAHARCFATGAHLVADRAANHAILPSAAYRHDKRERIDMF